MSRKNIENRLKYLQNRYNSFAMFTKVDKVEEKKITEKVDNKMESIG